LRVASPEPYILVVDDFADGREMLSEYLRFRGLPVVEAADGETALRLVRERKPTVVLMDLRMPGIDGWDTASALKNDPATSDVIIIAMSAHVMNKATATAFAVGCDGFIPKPYDLMTVADGVADVFQRGRDALAAHADLFHRCTPSSQQPGTAA
jgi:CheY-like chemotaxis protein